MSYVGFTWVHRQRVAPSYNKRFRSSHGSPEPEADLGAVGEGVSGETKGVGEPSNQTANQPFV